MEKVNIDLDKVKNVYMLGIKGAGMAALTKILKAKGFNITGSDVPERFPTVATLEAINLTWHDGFDANNINEDIDLVVYSPAYNESNEEFAKAKELGLTMVSYPQMVAVLFNAMNGISICGTDGKTTTTAMLGQVLNLAGRDPNVIVGSYVPQFNGGALVGDSKLFVLESCEYRNHLVLYDPNIVIITNITYDHADYFKTESEYIDIYREFIKRMPADGVVIANSDSANVKKILPEASCKVITYGLEMGCDYRITDIHLQQGRSCCKLHKQSAELCLTIPGDYNLLNATAVLACADYLGVPHESSLPALLNFKGTSRRFEYKGVYNGALIIDDYGHSPCGIKASLKGARDFYPDKNIICVHQPHTFTRTKNFLNEFAYSFNNADEVVILDIFPSAREEWDDEIHSKDLVAKIKEQGVNSIYISTIDEAVDYFKSKLKEGDVLISMGAGDAFRVGDALLALNEEK